MALCIAGLLVDWRENEDGPEWRLVKQNGAWISVRLAAPIHGWNQGQPPFPPFQKTKISLYAFSVEAIGNHPAVDMATSGNGKYLS